MTIGNGVVFSFGDGRNGCLGHGNELSYDVPNVIQYFFDPLFLEEISFIRCGYFHSMVVMKTGSLYLFGGNCFGQLGNDSNADILLPFRCEMLEKEIIIDCQGGIGHTVVLTREGIIYTMGSNEFGELGVGDNYGRKVPTIVDISVLTYAFPGLLV